EQLASAMQRLLDNPQLRADFSRKASARAAELYSWERIVDQYEALFAELADNDSSPAPALKVDASSESHLI
ncbi:MAG TPA: hypothetical protein VFU27_02905, partial [Terriglobales bacterium]|nr:hypothetical protein [Terriglobales bacterium]